MQENERCGDSEEGRWIRQKLANGIVDLAFCTRDPVLLDDALMYAKEAIEGLTREGHPNFWALGRCVLGNVHAAVGELRNSPRQILRALIHFEQAQIVFTRENSTLEWAELEERRGDAYLRLAQAQPGATLIEKAKRLFAAAFDVYREQEVISRLEIVQGKIRDADVAIN
jgi:hypothetical protein